VDIQAYIKSGVIESYVMGIADPGEAAELESLMASHPEVAAAVKEFEKSFEANAMANAVPVSDSTKDELLSTLKEEFSEKSGPPATIASLFRYSAAAVLLLLLSSIGVNIYLYRQYLRVNEDYTALLREKDVLLATQKKYENRIDAISQDIRAISAPGMMKVMMPGVAGKEENHVTLFWNTNTKEVFVHPDRLPAPPAGKQYQLWALVGGKPEDAGMLASCEGLCRMKTTANAEAFAITLENEGGSPTPTMEMMFVMGKVGSF
jgi:anti-sigma-K factor RskA